MWHLLTHTSGLTYGFHHARPGRRALPRRGLRVGLAAGHRPRRPAATRGPSCRCSSSPAREWNYGVSTDVLGRVVEVISGPAARRVPRRARPRPAGHGRDRLPRAGGRATAGSPRSTCPDPETGRATPQPRLRGRPSARPTTSPAAAGSSRPPRDYLRFTRMLLGGGELDGVRLLGPRTLRLMTANHLPGHADLEAFGRPLFAETTFDGVGFGLGFSVVEDPIAARYTELARRVRLGRRGQHRVLGRPRGADGGAVLHAAAAVEHAPDPLAAAPARPPGAGRLARRGSGRAAARGRRGPRSARARRRCAPSASRRRACRARS